MAGLILQLISLAIIIWSSVATTSKIGSEALSDICGFSIDDDFEPELYDVESFSWYILVIPQVINGFSQLLVFPAVIELILTDAPRVMHGLLIGLWYTMQSIHFIVGIIETATCAVFYWQYYIMKVVLVLVSIISFGVASFFYKRNQVMCNDYLTPIKGQNEAVTHSEDAV